MVNASLNWASIVGIVLAVGGTMLYFLRSFKPGLARDYDVFFAAVGLLCGGILFFQGWRLDPILQFGQFLLAATTVFFAYESVRLRSVTTEQARRSAFFDEDEPLPSRPRMGRSEWGNEDRFEDPQPLRRKIRSRADDMDEPEEEIDRDFYRPRRPERPAIPELALMPPQNLEPAAANAIVANQNPERKPARLLGVCPPQMIYLDPADALPHLQVQAHQPVHQGRMLLQPSVKRISARCHLVPALPTQTT